MEGCGFVHGTYWKVTQHEKGHTGDWKICTVCHAYETVSLVHVGGTRGVTWSIDRIIQIHARITWGVELILAILFIFFGFFLYV